MRNMKLSAVLRFICIFMTAFNVVMMTEIDLKKYKYDTAFAGYSCIKNDTIFEKNGTYDFLTCSKICHFTTNCVSFFYQPDSNQCIGCRVYLDEAQQKNRSDLMPRSLYFTDQDCPAGRVVVKRERTCYIEGPVDLTFHDAVNHCKKIGAHLVQAETNKENTFLKSLFNMRADGTFRFVWQGLTDIHTEGTWQWYSPQVNSAFSDWGDGELGNTTPELEDCAAFTEELSWKWADLVCSHQGAMTFCEKRYGE